MRSGLALISLTAAGCGGGFGRDDMFPVAGEVTHNGSPVPAGYVLLKPDDTVGQDGTQAYAEIVDGRFDTADRDKGVSGGKYVITVHGFTKQDGGSLPRPLFEPHSEQIVITDRDAMVTVDVPASRGRSRPLAPVEIN